MTPAWMVANWHWPVAIVFAFLGAWAADRQLRRGVTLERQRCTRITAGLAQAVKLPELPERDREVIVLAVGAIASGLPAWRFEELRDEEQRCIVRSSTRLGEQPPGSQ